MQYVLGNMLNGGGGLNPDGLSLDLQFAADKTLTARRGPTPVFTRLSGDNGGTTYFGPLVDFDVATAFSTTGISNGRASWFKSYEGTDITISYTGARWSVVTVDNGDEVTYLAAPGGEWRPDQADWSGEAVSVTTSSTFGIVKAANNEPRFDHNTTSPFACRGLLIEEGRTNLVFPSDALTTQTRTVTAVAHTLSFYGTGTVVLSGVHSATVVGTGAYPTRTTLTFTPTAGSLTLTVTGSVTQAQLEVGSFATSYIPTTTGTLARSADVCSYSDVSSFYNPAAGTLVGDLILYTPSTSSAPELFRFGAGNNRIQLGVTSVATEAIRPFIISGGTTTYNSTQGTIVAGTSRKVALTFATNDAISCLNGTLGTQDTSVTMPVSISTAFIGASALTGHIASIRYYRKRLPNAKLVALTT